MCLRNEALYLYVECSVCLLARIVVRWMCWHGKWNILCVLAWGVKCWMCLDVCISFARIVRRLCWCLCGKWSVCVFEN